MCFQIYYFSKSTTGYIYISKCINAFGIIKLYITLHYLSARRGGVVSTPSLYSGGPGYKSWSGDMMA